MSYYVVRQKSPNLVLHWVGPILGFLIIGYVLWNAEPAAKIGGLVWLVIGILVLVYYSRKGIGILPEHGPMPPPSRLPSCSPPPSRGADA